MKDEIKSIIDKYTGKTIDDIPDRFTDVQTLEIRKLIRFIKSGSLLDNTCEKHTDFVGDVCPVCLQELRENLKCCGNCKLYAKLECSYCKVYHGWPTADGVCPSWTFDGLNKTERNDKSK